MPRARNRPVAAVAASIPMSWPTPKTAAKVVEEKEEINAPDEERKENSVKYEAPIRHGKRRKSFLR